MLEMMLRGLEAEVAMATAREITATVMAIPIAKMQHKARTTGTMETKEMQERGRKALREGARRHNIRITIIVGSHKYGTERRRQLVLGEEEHRVGRACEEKRYGETDE